jgi:hypothetical protein
MTHSLAALMTLVLLWLSAAVARYVRPRLPETHRTRETIETMQLMIGMLVTFAALVLGLLTASVKNSYDNAGRDRQGYALQLTQLDRCLRDYGPAADPIRDLLKSYTAAIIASTWPKEPKPEGVRYPDTSGMPLVGADPELVGIMDQAGLQLRRFEPADVFHAKLAAHCLSIYDDVLKAREAVIQDVGGRLSWPFYCILVFWLVIIFAAFGLAAPRNRLALIAILLCAISLSSTIFIISELSDPYGGLLSISSDDMRTALARMMAPARQ